jgi:GT2 family glycosyltransferase
LEVAIVILNWNGKGLLETFLPSIIRYSKEATIYVADNASTDHSVDFVKTSFPSIKIIQNIENGGYAKGYNDALKHIEADIFCLVNSDIEVSEHWLAPIISTFKAEPQTAIIQPIILDFTQKTLFEYAGAAGGYIDKYGYPFCRGRIFDTIEADTSQYNENAEIFWASGACFFIRATVFNTLKGFDESFFAHMEEIDLCWRAHNMGYTSKYIYQSTVYHVGGATLNATNPKKTYLNFRNRLFTLTKNDSGDLFFILFSRMVLDGLAAAKFLSELKFSHILAILKAHFGFYANLPRLLKQRKQLQQSKKYFKTKSIVWLYYVNKKKLFSRL